MYRIVATQKGTCLNNIERQLAAHPPLVCHLHPAALPLFVDTKIGFRVMHGLTPSAISSNAPLLFNVLA